MKKTGLLLLSFAAGLFATAQKTYTISGSFENTAKKGKVFCTHKLGDEYVRDSATIKDGRFSLEGKIDEACIAYLSYRPETAAKTQGRADRLDIFMEPGIMELYTADSLKYGTLKGSASNDIFRKKETMLKPVRQQMTELYGQYDVAYKAKDEEKMKAIETKIEILEKGEQASQLKSFIEHFPNSPVALGALDELAGYDMDVPAVEPLWNVLDASLKNSVSGKDFGERLEIARKTQVGQLAMDFEQNNTEGKAVKLSDFRGKYVLVDFWASWCGPCRKENPNVVANYHKYKTKNFTVLGVSLDNQNQKERWLKAIKDDKLEWTQVSDLKGWENVVAVQYGIKAIPQNLLVGPDGKIVARNLREDKLRDELKKLFGE